MNAVTEEILNTFQNEYSRKDPAIIFNKRPKDGNISVAFSSKRGSVFAYMDFVKGSLIARLKVFPSNIKLAQSKGIWRNYTGSHKIGSWDEKVIEIVMDDPTKIKKYIEIFEIAKQDNINLK